MKKWLWLLLLLPTMAMSQTVPTTYFSMHDLFDTAACPGCNPDASPQSLGANYGSLRLGPLVSWGGSGGIEPNAPSGYPGCEPGCTHVYNWTFFDNIVKGNVAHGVT